MNEELTAYVTCPHCEVSLPAAVKKILASKDWTDYEGNRTLTVEVAFESKHKCIPGPVEIEASKPKSKTLPLEKTTSGVHLEYREGYIRDGGFIHR
jgi:hypothetical protein